MTSSHEAPELAALPPTQQRILDTAADLFEAEGVRAIGVNAISARAGVSKDTLYRYYASKDELVVAVLQRRDAEWCAWLREGVEQRAADAKLRLRAVFELLDEDFRGQQYRGSAFLGASTDFADPAHPVRRACAEHKARVCHYLKGLATDASARDPAALARSLMLLVDGAICARTMQDDRAAGRHAGQAAEVLIREATR